MVDAANLPFLIRGVNVPGLETGNTAAFTEFHFRVIRQRWNMNGVRLPVSVALWQRDGAAYLETVASAVALANAEHLLVILSAYGDGPLPTTVTADFWRACAQWFRDTPGVIFDLFNEPSANGATGSRWTVWQGALQPLVDAIRSTGAAQIISASAFQDSLEFRGFTSSAALRDANVIYEIHPFYDLALTDDARDAGFGFLTPSYPVYAGAWGAPFGQNTAACRALPSELVKVFALLLQTMLYFDVRGISWTASDFAPGSLVQELTKDTATQLTDSWTCDGGNLNSGIGQFVLLLMTGDPNGFGSLDPNLIVSAAGGFVGPIAPGQIISIYGQGVGPDIPAAAETGPDGRIATTLGEVQVLFDGRPAPILLAGAFQTNVQVPYEVEGQTSTSMQLLYRGIPSNVVDQSVVPAAPGILADLGTSDAEVINQDGTVNGRFNPAARGSVVSLFATGTGVMLPAVPTGEPAGGPLAGIAQSVRVDISAHPAEILYAGAAPGLTGVAQVNVRLPDDLPIQGTERVSVVLKVGSASSRQGVTFWAK